MVQGLNENSLPGYIEEHCGICSPSLCSLGLQVRKSEPGETPIESGQDDFRQRPVHANAPGAQGGWATDPLGEI